MKPRELLKVAAELARGRKPPEPKARSAVNRAYYAAYGELSAHIGARGFVRRPKRNSHETSWNFLRHQINDGDAYREAQRRTIADTGIRLKTRRVKADYNLSARLADHEGKAAIRESKAIIKGLDALDAAKHP